MIGRDVRGRFAPGYSADRGRGKPPGRWDGMLNTDLRRLVMEVANLPVSIPRGRGRRIVTLFEALIRRLASGRIKRRAAVMNFIRLVLDSADQEGHDPARVSVTATHPAIARLQAQLVELKLAAASPDATELARGSVGAMEVLIEVLHRGVPR